MLPRAVLMWFLPRSHWQSLRAYVEKLTFEEPAAAQGPVAPWKPTPDTVRVSVRARAVCPVLTVAVAGVGTPREGPRQHG